MSDQIPNLPGFLMSVIELDPAADVHEAVLGYARDSFRAHRKLRQTFFVRTAYPEPKLMLMLPQDPEGENGGPVPPWVVDTVRRFARASQASAVWCASEAWWSPNTPGDYRRPSARPDKRECVLVSYECPLARPPMQMWIAQIDRSARPKLLHWVPRHDNAFSLDRLQYMLPREAYGPVADA